MTHTQNLIEQNNKGGRKPIIGDIKAQQLIENYTGLKDGIHDRTDLIFLFEKAAPTLKITPTARDVYRFLISRTSLQDWNKNSLAIVWYSNIEIAHQLGISKKTLKRAIHNLRQLSLIGFKDSPSRQRRGARDENNNIILSKTFGIVLNPIAGMIKELKAKIKTYQTQHKRKRAISKARTVLKRQYEDMLPHITENLTQAQQTRLENMIHKFKNISIETKNIETKERAVKAINRCLIKTRKALNALSTLKATLSFLSHSINHNKTPKGGQINPSIINITKSSITISNELSDKEVTQRPAPNNEIRTSGKETNNQKHDPSKNEKPSFVHIRASLPYHLKKQLREDHGYYQMWDILEIQASIHAIKPELFSYARKVMGIERSCAIMSIIIEKYPTIKAPSKYFRSLITRFENNELNIERSLFGIIKRRKENKAYDDIARRLDQMELEMS